MTRTTRIPDQRCRRCNYKFTASTYLQADIHPRPGDISVCIGCGLVQIFGPDLMLRDPTPEEKTTLDRNQQVMDMQFAVAVLPPRKK